MLQKTLDVVSAKERAQKKLLQLQGVHAVGIGNKMIAGEYSGIVAIIVSVDKKIEAKLLDSDQLIPPEIDGFLTDVIARPRRGAVSDIFAFELGGERVKQECRVYSPLVGGCRIVSALPNGKFDGGTLGVVVMSRNNKPAILSNRHVLCGVENPVTGGRVHQPGNNPKIASTQEYPVATVTEFSSGYDAAVAELDAGISWTNFVLDIGPIQGTYDVQPADIPYRVRKRGAMTGVSDLVVTELNVSGVDCNNTPYTVNMQVKGPTGSYAQGDSGSVLVDDQYRIVGLLYQFWPQLDFAEAEPIDKVISALGVTIITNNSPTLYMVHRGRNDWRCHETENTNDRWNGDALIHPWDAYGLANAPGLCMYQTELFNMREASVGNHDTWCARFDGAWHDDARLAPTKDPSNFYGTTGAPGMAVYNGRLYCVHLDSRITTAHKLWCFTYDGLSYSDDVLLAPTGDPGNKYLASHPPSLVVFGGKLWCFYAYDYRMYCFTYDSNTNNWSQSSKLAPTSDPGNYYGSNATPAVVSYRNKLHCIHLGSDFNQSDDLWHFTYDGSNWSADEKIAPTSDPKNFSRGSYGPAAIVKDGKIYCYHEGSNQSGDIWYFSYDGTTWSSDIQMPPADYGTTFGPSVAFRPQFDASFNGGHNINSTDKTRSRIAACSDNSKLYLFWKSEDDSDTIIFSVSSDGSSWPAGKRINDHDKTVDSPAACFFNNQPYVFWRAHDDSGRLFFSTSTDGGATWSGGAPINDVDSSSTTPVACTFKNRLYLFFKARWSNDILGAYSTDGKTWQKSFKVSGADSTWSGPGACVFNNLFDNRILVFWKAADDSNKLHVISSNDGEYWGASNSINDYDKTSDSPSACARNGKLFLFWRPPDSTGTMYFSSKDNTGTKDWNQGRLIDPSQASPFSPTACVHNGRVYLFYKSNTDNSIFYTKEVKI